MLNSSPQFRTFKYVSRLIRTCWTRWYHQKQFKKKLIIAYPIISFIYRISNNRSIFNSYLEKKWIIAYPIISPCSTHSIKYYINVIFEFFYQFEMQNKIFQIFANLNFILSKLQSQIKRSKLANLAILKLMLQTNRHFWTRWCDLKCEKTTFIFSPNLTN